MKINSDKQHMYMYTLNMHIPIPNTVLLKLPCLQLLLSSADYHYKQSRSRSGPKKTVGPDLDLNFLTERLIRRDKEYSMRRFKGLGTIPWNSFRLDEWYLDDASSRFLSII